MAKKKTSHLEDAYLLQVINAGLPCPEREFLAIPDRKFRFDFFFRDVNLLVEIQGGLFMRRGGHTSGVGVSRDCEKANLAELHGFHQFSFTGTDVKDGTAIEFTCAFFNKKR